MRPLRNSIQSARDVEISWHRTSRRELWGLFALAEESPAVIEELMDRGQLLVATVDGEVVGCLQLLDPDALDCEHAESLALVEAEVADVRRAMLSRPPTAIPMTSWSTACHFEIASG